MKQCSFKLTFWIDVFDFEVNLSGIHNNGCVCSCRSHILFLLEVYLRTHSPTTSTMEGQCRHIMTPERLIVWRYAWKSGSKPFSLYSCYQCSEVDVAIPLLPAQKKSSCVRMAVLREFTLKFSSENNRMNTFSMCSLSVDFEFFVCCLCLCSYYILFLKWALANPAADPGQSPGAVSVVISLSRSVD